MTFTSYFYIGLSSSPSTLVQQTAEPKAGSCRSTANAGAVECKPQLRFPESNGPQLQRTKQCVHSAFQV